MNALIEKTMKNLKKNNMNAFYVDTKEDVIPLVEKLVAVDILLLLKSVKSLSTVLSRKK